MKNNGYIHQQFAFACDQLRAERFVNEIGHFLKTMPHIHTTDKGIVYVRVVTTSPKLLEKINLRYNQKCFPDQLINITYSDAADGWSFMADVKYIGTTSQLNSRRKWDRVSINPYNDPNTSKVPIYITICLPYCEWVELGNLLEKAKKFNPEHLSVSDANPAINKIGN